MYTAKRSGTTEKGSEYTMLQVGQASFSISVQRDSNVISETFENPPSLEFLENSILVLEDELLTSTEHKTS